MRQPTKKSILWTGGWSGRVQDATVGMMPPFIQQIDVKAKRKLTRADNVRFVVSETDSGAGTKWFGVLRCLLQVK